VNDDLMIPDFLQRSRGEAPKKFRAPRWTKLSKAVRPDGEKWTAAKRWEVQLHDEVPKLGCGRRMVWVVEGRKWARIADGGATCKVPMSIWGLLARSGKEVA
jgi:hypothetical protein